MKSLRLALLASCIAIPAMAQEIPAAGHDGATARATADAQRAVAEAQARVAAADAQAHASATASMQGTTSARADAGTVPRTMPPAIDPIAPDKPLTRKEQVGLTIARTWINKFQTPHLDEDGVEHFTAGKGQVFVVTAVNHVTDIGLAPGEIIAPPLHIGDADSWKFHPAMSGSGRKTVSHILVKPIDAGLSTNIVIETNKRTISVALTSRRSDYMPLVSLDIPDESGDKGWTTATNVRWPDGTQAAATTQASPCDQQPVIPPAQFKITGDDVTWRPLQAYVVSTPVGMKTCIDFPSSIGSEDLPALLALADDGGWFWSPTKKMINVRYVHRRFIADEQLTRFILVDGVGGDQRSITIRQVSK